MIGSVSDSDWRKVDSQMKWRAVVAMAAALFMLVGCGKAAGEKAAENLVNSLLGDAGIQVSDGGETVTFTGEDGTSMNFSAVDEGKIPDGLVLPVFPGMKTDGFVETKTDGKTGWIGTLYFDGDVEAIAAQYEQALKDMGFDPGMMSMKDDDGFTAIFFASGEVGGKYYSGMLTMGEESEDNAHALGKNYLSMMFGEGDPPED